MPFSGPSSGIAIIISSTVLTSSPWYIVLVTFERLCIVYFPMKVCRHCRMKERGGWIASYELGYSQACTHSKSVYDNTTESTYSFKLCRRDPEVPSTVFIIEWVSQQGIFIETSQNNTPKNQPKVFQNSRSTNSVCFTVFLTV